MTWASHCPLCPCGRTFPSLSYFPHLKNKWDLMISWGPSKCNNLWRETDTHSSQRGRPAGWGESLSEGTGEPRRLTVGWAAGDPILRVDNGSLGIAGSSCGHLTCLLACGRSKMEK